MTLELREFAGGGEPAALLPPRTAQSAPWLDALAEGRLVVQSCAACGRARWPIAPVCPWCGAREWGWRECGGEGTVHSWVRYRRGYLPEFEPLMPYVVLCVALAEGPRMFGRLLDGEQDPAIGMPVRAVVERAGEYAAVAWVRGSGGVLAPPQRRDV